MIFAQLALALVILCVCGFAPGFFVVRRLRWNPLEKLCGSVGLSLVLLWLVLWVLYVCPPGAWMAGSIATSLACATLGILAWRDVCKLFAATRVRRAVVAFGFLLLWTLVILATIRHYSGATWFGDWLEHFQRTLVFLKHLPPTTEIFGAYRIPSRPPLAHVIAAFVMAQTQDTFEIYHIVLDFLTLLMFLPCCLLLPLVARPWKFGILPLACIFAMSPVMMVNATLTGTKPITVGFEVLAVALYLRGWKKNDPARMSLAFLAAAGGSLAHYSGLPYALFLGLHYLLAVLPGRRQGWKELASITGAAAVPLFAWFGWCVAWFGVQGTFTAVAKASVVYGKTYEGGFFLKFLLNLVDALVPHLVRDSTLVTAWGQPNTPGYIRDNTFLVYQSNLIFTMGLIGGPLVYWLLVRALKRRQGAERNFWLALVPFSVTACFILAGERDVFGQAHITLLSMMAIGLSLLAGNFTSRRSISLLIVAGCAIDFSLGVFLQTRIEHLEATPDPAVFARIQVSGVRMDIAPAGPNTLARTSGGNWFRKHQYALSQKWLAALPPSTSDGHGLTPAQANIQRVLTEVVRQDDTMFGGWFKQHGGELVFFGDHFGDSDFTSGLLVLGAIGMLWKMARYAPPRRVAPAVPPKATPARRKR